MKLLSRYEKKVSEMFSLPDDRCHKCQTEIRFPKEFVLKVDTQRIAKDLNAVNVQDVLSVLTNKHRKYDCCQESIRTKSLKGKCIVLNFTHPLLVNISKTENFDKLNILAK